MNKFQNEIKNYYSKFESKIGYTLVLGNAKHFGFYPEAIANIPEKKALELHQDLIATTLGLSPRENVLDAGCGRGVTASYIAKKYNVNITGIDLLDFELEKAKSISNKENQNVNFLQMDYSNLTFPENSFDALYTSETLSHSENIEKVLQGFLKVLKPGGRFVFLEYTIAPDDDFLQTEIDSLNFVIDGSAMFGLKNFRHDKFVDILKKVGFENVIEKNITQNIRPSFDRLYSKSKIAYKIISLLGLEKRFVNTATPSKLLPLINKGLIRYCIFQGRKPLC